jgi:hypothetical protein
MDDLSDTFNEERSELLYGTENAVQRGVQFMQNVRKAWISLEIKMVHQ